MSEGKAKGRRRELKSYLVTVQETVMREYVVDAVNEDDARENYGRDAKTNRDVTETDLTDWKVMRVEINE